jgi:hypothetical protein
VNYKESMPSEMGQITNALLRLTREGKVRWEPTDKDNQYLFSTTRSSTVVSKIPSGNGYIYGLQLLNVEGAVVTTFRGSVLYDEKLKKWVSDDINRKLEELYYQARTNALMIESTLKDIYGALGIDSDEQSG